jgi:hypothetical protein
VTLEWPAAQATLLDALTHRREQLEQGIVAMIPDSPWSVQVGRLRCLRGIDTLTAVGLCAEIGDFERFARAEQLMSYIGLVPCENTTGQQRRLGSITKTGSGSRPPAAGRGSLALPHPTERRPRAERPPRAPATGGDRGRVERPAATTSHLGQARSTRVATVRPNAESRCGPDRGSESVAPPCMFRERGRHVFRALALISVAAYSGRTPPVNGPYRL